MSVVPPPMSIRQTPSSRSSSRQHRLGRGERLEHDVGDVQAGLVRALHDVLRARHRRRDDVDLGLEPHAAHAERLADAVLLVDDELLREHVDDLAVHRDRHGLGRVDHAPMSLSATSWSFTATMPWELKPLMWPPAMPA